MEVRSSAFPQNSLMLNVISQQEVRTEECFAAVICRWRLHLPLYIVRSLAMHSIDVIHQ